MPEPDLKLMHETLIGLRNDIREMRTEMREQFVDVKNRINQLEGGMSLVLHYAGDRASIDAEVNRQLDLLKQRVQQLEEQSKAV